LKILPNPPKLPPHIKGNYNWKLPEPPKFEGRKIILPNPPYIPEFVKWKKSDWKLPKPPQIEKVRWTKSDWILPEQMYINVNVAKDAPILPDPLIIPGYVKWEKSDW
jgi:hypothetical protein